MRDNATISNRPSDIITLNYDQLRAEGIQHLEQMAPFIWTDYNAHDPGITTLEVLCYALTDLGYRTRMIPEADLFAAGAGKPTDDFFEAIDVLTCSPVTELDFRKILIDLPYIKNAWLKVDTTANTYLGGKILNGIYKIYIDLDDSVDHNNTFLLEKIKKSVMARLHANRALCEDFTEPKVVVIQKICLDMNLVLATDADERVVYAEVLAGLQEFIAPTPRFRTLREMREKGYATEDIFNGPVLTSGFLDEIELGKAILPTKLYKSDLVAQIMNHPSVKSVKYFSLKKREDASFLGNNWWEFDFTNKDFPPKLLIDFDCSIFKICKNGISQSLNFQLISPELDKIRLLNEPLITPESLKLTPSVNGTFREDLSEYVSIQEEFPNAYGIGELGLPDSAKPKRRAQAKQFQAYLTFFDQLLAGYLQHLSHVHELLSVKQNADTPTQFRSPLYEVAGMKDLLIAAGLSKDDILMALSKQSDYTKLSPAVIEKLSHLKDKFYLNGNEVVVKVQAALTLTEYGEVQTMLIAAIDKVESNPKRWEQFKANPNNDYAQKLSGIAESPAAQQAQKNALLTHLIARFGEQFSDYVLTILRPDQHPADAQNPESFKEYLVHKADFLHQLPKLSGERGRAYNYKLLKTATDGQPDVWNSDNVSGVHKRVARMLGITDYGRVALSPQPAYKIRLRAIETKRGIKEYQLQLLDPQTELPLLTSVNKFRQKKDAEELRGDIYEAMTDKPIFKEVPKNLKWVLQLSLKENVKPIMESDEMDEDSARSLRARLSQKRAAKHNEIIGFHLIEHILLRPNDKNDFGLWLPELSPKAIQPPPKFDVNKDPYSFYVTVVLPNWVSRFNVKNDDFKTTNSQIAVEQTFRREMPAGVLPRFCWVGEKAMREFEVAFEKWLEEKAKCTPNMCNVAASANVLIEWLNKYAASQQIQGSCDENYILPKVTDEVHK